MKVVLEIEEKDIQKVFKIVEKGIKKLKKKGFAIKTGGN